MNKYSFCSEFSHEQIGQYDDMLDLCHEQVKIGELTFNPSDVIFNCDPVAYRCGLIDYISSIEEDNDDE